MHDIIQETHNNKGLSKLDKFGLISGIIGLVTDVATLLSFLFITQPSRPAVITLWLFGFVSVAYTLSVVSFYSRRFFVVKLKRENRKITQERVEKVESASGSVLLIIGIPICIVLLSGAFLSVDTSMPIEQQSPWGSIAASVFLGVIGGYFLCYAIHELVKEVYAAFDVEYVPSKKKR